MTAGFLVRPADDHVVVVRDLPHRLVRNTSGFAFASATVSGSSGQPG